MHFMPGEKNRTRFVSVTLMRRKTTVSRTADSVPDLVDSDPSPPGYMTTLARHGQRMLLWN